MCIRDSIKRDPTAPHYKFHDDPYLIPVSNHAKRTFALSQESGRKAAMWVMEQHPELFHRIEADPPIEVSIWHSYFVIVCTKNTWFLSPWIDRHSCQNRHMTNSMILMKLYFWKPLGQLRSMTLFKFTNFCWKWMPVSVIENTRSWVLNYYSFWRIDEQNAVLLILLLEKLCCKFMLLFFFSHFWRNKIMFARVDLFF